MAGSAAVACAGDLADFVEGAELKGGDSVEEHLLGDLEAMANHSAGAGGTTGGGVASIHERQARREEAGRLLQLRRSLNT